MILFKDKSSLGWLLAALTSLVLSAALFASGYVFSEWHEKQVSAAKGGNFPSIDQSSAMRAMTPNAAPAKELVENRALLAKNLAELRSLNKGTPDPQTLVRFQQEQAQLLKRQSDLSESTAHQQAIGLIPAPPPLRIPSNASPQLRAFLTTRDAIMRDQIAVMNKHKDDDLVKREAAMQEWRQENAARFQQLKEQMQALSAASQT